MARKNTEEDSQQELALQREIIDTAVAAITHNYTQCDKEVDADEVLTDLRLRQLWNITYASYGTKSDPLPLYKKVLFDLGWRQQMTADGRFALFVKYAG